MVMVSIILHIDLHSKVGLGMGATKLPGSVIIRLGSFLRRSKSSKLKVRMSLRNTDHIRESPKRSLLNVCEMHLYSIGVRLRLSVSNFTWTRFTWTRFLFSVFKFIK